MLKNALASSETARGVWASFIVALLFVWIEVMLESARVSPDATFMYGDILGGSTIGFLADKIFATNVGYKLLQSGNWRGAIRMAVMSTSSGEFVRYLVTVFIDALISVPLFVRVLRTYPNMKPLVRRAVKYGIALITFATFNNSLRFNWAYTSPTNTMDTIVGAFLVCSSMAYLNSESVEDPTDHGYSVMKKSRKMIILALGWGLFSLYSISRMGVRFPVPNRWLVLGTIAATVGVNLFSNRNSKTSDTQLSDHIVGIIATVVAISNVVWFLRMTKRTKTQNM
jgi:hypothetical protein